MGTTGQLTASTTPGEHPSIGASVLDPSHDVNRWWSLTNLGTAFDVLAATFTFGPGDIDPGAQPGQFVVARWDGSWTLPALAGQTGTSITAAGITSLGAFAVGEVAFAVGEVAVAPSSLPDVALSMRAPGGIRALSLVFSAWVLLLLTLAVVTARRQRRRR